MASLADVRYNGLPMAADDNQLVRDAQRGSLAAFEGLFRSHEKRVYHLALHMLGDAEAAEDVTQEAFVRAWGSLQHLRQRKAFGGWVRRIALNLIWDCLRARPREEPLGAELATAQAEGADPPEVAVVRAGIARTVREAVMDLPEHQRLVVTMFYWEGMGVKEIAAALGIARGTALSRLARGREALRPRLATMVAEPSEMV